MKKVKFLRLASVMLMLCLITTCAISGTFAKYTEEGTATDSARVAAWGVTVTGNFDADGSAFAKTYDSETAGFTGMAVSATQAVMAPGTGGTLADVEVTGSPEVAVKLTYSADLTLTNWTDGTSAYCPIVITVNGTAYKMGLTESTNVFTDIADFETAVEDAIEATAAKNIAVGFPIDGDLAVSWSWAYEGGAGAYQTDSKDTLLTTQSATISLAVTVTVEQIN